MKKPNSHKIVFRFFVIVFFLIGISKIALSDARSTPVILVKDHLPKATIILADSASRQIQDVAKVLQNYISQSTGALIPISNDVQPNTVSIHIGLTSYVKNHLNIKSLDEDAFVLDGRNSQNYIIAGGSDWGTEFGVYSFLERFVGVVWLMPTQIGVDIPTHVTLSVPDLKIVDSPVYISREIFPIFINTETPIGAWGRFNRLRGRINFTHNLLNLFDPKEFYETNPDFYPMVNGKHPMPFKFSWQPNFSAPGIVDSGSQKIIRYFKQNPKASSYSLGINDYTIFDQSPASLLRRKGNKNYLGLEDVSDDYFEWANEVVKKVTKVFPNKEFGLLAYSNVADPPSKEIGVDSHMVPFLTYERMRWSDSTLRLQGHQLTKAWGEICKNIGWYDYCYGYNYLVPRVWFHEMQDYLKWGSKHNVKYYFASLNPNWGEGPKPWLQSKLLWNPNYNVDSLLNIWYVRTAGEKAAYKLKEFYTIWEGFWTKDIYSSNWNTNRGQYLPFNNFSYLDAVPVDYITRSDALMKSAMNLAGTDLQKKRVAKLMEMWNVYKMAVELYQNANMPANEKQETLAASPEFNALLNNLKDDSIHSYSVQRIKRTLKIP